MVNMGDEVTSASIQVGMHTAEKAVDVATKVAGNIIDSIAKLLQALSNKQASGGKEKVSKTDLTDIKPGEVGMKDLIQNARKNGDSIVTSENGLTAADKKYISKKAKEYGIPVSFTGGKGQDNLFANVRKSDLPVLQRICTEMMKDKLAERPQELGNFKVQAWEMPFLTSELNKHDLSAQFGTTKSGEHFCLYEKADEKAIMIARNEFVRKSDEVKKELAMDRDENGFYTIKDLRTGKEITFDADSMPSREELSAQMQEKFGYDKNKADISCARFGEEQLQGMEKQKFFSSDPQQSFSRVDTNITLEGESIHAKPYTCWRVTPKQDGVPKLVFQNENGKFAVLNPEKQTKKQMCEVLRTQLGITDQKTLDALTDKASRVTDYYNGQNQENFSHNYTFEKKDFLTSNPEAMEGMRRTDAEGNVYTKTLPFNDISNSIERTGKNGFTVTSTMNVVETDQNGVQHTSSDTQQLVLSFSDKKNAIAELTAMYRQQGVPEHIAKPMAKEVFAKAQTQSAEKVLQIEEIRAEVPQNPSSAETQTEIYLTVRVGNQTEEINISDREKAVAEVSEKFGVSEEEAENLLERAEETIQNAAEEASETVEEEEEKSVNPDETEQEETPEKAEKVETTSETMPTSAEEASGMAEMEASEVGGKGQEAPMPEAPEMPEMPEMPKPRGRH